jgi:ectoine hydroxylase-related dioxygenase (phytanoyl-CoA dioxygenase family)
MMTTTDTSYAEIVERDGFTVLADVLDDTLISELRTTIGAVTSGDGVYNRGGVYAIRNLLKLAPDVKNALRAPKVRDVVESVLGRDAMLVRGLYLDKIPRTNWAVSWHQDAAVTVKARGEATGFGPWSTKGGVQHVMAPPGLLAYMLTIRLHLDECGEDQGGLKAISASHQYGRLPLESIGQFTSVGEVACNVPKGGLLAFRPLLIHASDAAKECGSRRVIQLEFCARKLPLPLEWYEAYPVFD